ncbi:MAG: hypothetical protein ACK4GO_07695 [Gemmobacter sp.]
MPQDRTIICIKWGTLYPAEYVNVLYRAVCRHLQGSFRFVCLTDDGKGLLAGIDALPIPDIGLMPAQWRGGCWPKVGLFSDPLHDLAGTALFLDLDSVIVGDLGPIFDLPGDIVTLDSGPWRYGPGTAPRAMSCFLRYRIGEHGDLVDRFRRDRDRMIARYGNDQNFLLGEGPSLSYFPQEWVVSFKYHLRQPLLMDRFRGPRRPPPEARLLAFHGRPRPIDLIRPPAGNWDVFPHFGRGKVDWMVDYWTEHGGTA